MISTGRKYVRVNVYAHVTGVSQRGSLRGNLNSRSNTALSWSETFTYDNQDRLTNFNDNNGNNSQSYDARGRITNNSALGNYGYSGVSYQQIELTNPTPEATAWYSDRTLQQIIFNAFKKPVNITEAAAPSQPGRAGEGIDFLYNAALQRSTMYYGSDDTDKTLRPMRRHYSEDGGMEITRNLTTGETSFIFYLSGDAYSAPAIYKEVHNSSGTTQDLYYLHRDHLGSIVLITNVDGNAVEKRQFDAWGNIVALTDGNDNPLTAFVILDRGYTGHEHLFNVGLINMNGRLYDPMLHRFLSPDNFVQDPYNTQNFNRYGYVMNNPLSNIDPTGEFLGTILGFIKGVFDAIFSGGLEFWNAGKDYVSNAWRKADPTLTGTAGNNGWKIDKGLLKGSFLQVISRFTWELPQTLLGYGYSVGRNSLGNVRSVTYWGGATAVEGYGDPNEGLTLGSYINGGRGLKADPNNSLFQHEYGHYLQSQASGVFYLGKYAIPSALSKNTTQSPHYLNPVEQDANVRAFKYFNRKIDGYTGWNFDRRFKGNPIRGYDETKPYSDASNQLALKNGKLSLKWFDFGLFTGFGTIGLGITNTFINNSKY